MSGDLSTRKSPFRFNDNDWKEYPPYFGFI